MSGKIRVAILDDHQSIVDGYCYRLSQDKEIEVVDTGAFGDELDAMLNNHEVDVLILDINVPTSQDNNNPYPILHIIPNLLQQYPHLVILIISMYHQTTLVKNVLEAGASGYILKDDRQTIKELASVVRTVANGGIHLSRLAHQKLNKHWAQFTELSPRQLEVISLCAAYPGKTTTEIAQLLNVADSTVRNLLSQAYLRLNVRNRMGAVAKARQLGLISPEMPGVEA